MAMQRASPVLNQRWTFAVSFPFGTFNGSTDPIRSSFPLSHFLAES